MDWRALPSLNALRAFLAFHQAGSMAAAGAALNVSHAAISQQIKALEAELGLPLLDRQPRRARLTPEGLRLAEALEQGFGEVARVIAALTGAADSQPLQISTTPAFATRWLMPRLAGFRESHPDISLMIDPTAEPRRLEPGGIELAIRAGNGSWPGLEARLLMPAPVVLVAAPSLVPETAGLGPGDLLHLPWLQELGTHECSDWLQRQGIEAAPAAGISSMPGYLMIEALREGQGVGTAARPLVEADIQAGRLQVLFEDPTPLAYYLVTRPGPQRDAAKAFIRWLLRQSGL